MHTPILHHYNESPYAEKARLMLGHKGLTWRSVKVPRVAPKPDLVALTGGYRKVPVLQVGADIYCDTRLIAEVLDTLQPEPSLRARAGHFDEIVANWVDTLLFGRAVGYTFGALADLLPDALLEDRAALRGAPLEREALKRALPLATQELHSHIAWLDTALRGNSSFVNGETPGNGDFTLYATLWFLANGRFDFSRHPAVQAWMTRMIGIGHGHREDISAEEALVEAAAALPAPLPDTAGEQGSADATGLILGQVVQVTPEQLGHGTSVTGELVSLLPQRLTLRLRSERCGELHVHFPRTGYRLKAAQGTPAA